MRVPSSEDELLVAMKAGELAETATLDAKRALPKQGKSKDLAIDVAAMANDGGTLIYGVGKTPQPILASCTNNNGYGRAN
jgi:schlafen family protein